jgi:hypothetical protein
MKLWHDDIRLPPDDDWAWARTNGAAVMYLVPVDGHGHMFVDTISLDHDLGLDNEDPNAEDAWLQMGHSPNGTGLDLIDWMIHNERMPLNVIVHTMNAPAGERMIRTLTNARDRGLISRKTTIIRRPFSAADIVR